MIFSSTTCLFLLELGSYLFPDIQNICWELIFQDTESNGILLQRLLLFSSSSFSLLLKALTVHNSCFAGVFSSSLAHTLLKMDTILSILLFLLFLFSKSTLFPFRTLSSTKSPT